jgi:peptidyl-prolyl cis-trans isomerase C
MNLLCKCNRALLILLTGTLFFAAPFLYAQTAAQGEEADSDREIASVNGIPILKIAFDRQMNIARQQFYRQGMLPDEEQMKQIRAQVLEDLISNELLYQESQKYGVTIKNDDVEKRYSEVRSQFSDEAQFKSAMDAMNYTEKSLKDDLERMLAVDAFINEELVQKTTVTEDETRDFYDENPNYFTQPEQVRASHILITTNEQDNTEKRETALQKIKEVQTKLKSGEDFASLAEEYSEGPSSKKGGDLGFFQRGQMVKAFEDAAFALKKGEVSDIVETSFGYHLIIVTDRKAEMTAPYDSVKVNIVQHLQQKRVMEKARVLLDTLRETATITKDPSVIEGSGENQKEAE